MCSTANSVVADPFLWSLRCTGTRQKEDSDQRVALRDRPPVRVGGRRLSGDVRRIDSAPTPLLSKVHHIPAADHGHVHVGRLLLHTCPSSSFPSSSASLGSSSSPTGSSCISLVPLILAGTEGRWQWRSLACSALLYSVSQIVFSQTCTVSRSLELPATTEGRLLRGSHSLGHKAGTWTVCYFLSLRRV